MPLATLRSAVVALVVLAALAGPRQAAAQGCVNSKLVSPGVSLGADDLKLLGRGGWDIALAYRNLRADDLFVGSTEMEAPKRAGLTPDGRFNSIDLGITYGIDDRFSVTGILPLLHSRGEFRQPDGLRHWVNPGLHVGDVRLQANAWLLDPARDHSGNVALSLGVKLPTGSYDAAAPWHMPDGPQTTPVDMALQPGDGGVGVVLHVQGYRRLAARVFGYTAAFYVANPRGTNGTLTPAGGGLALSVPDQYMVRGGIGVTVAPSIGLLARLGIRYDGIPQVDLFGGSEGFRRPGYNLALEPSLDIGFGRNVVSVAVPLSLSRARDPNIHEERAGVAGGGVMADRSVHLSYSRRF